MGNASSCVDCEKAVPKAVLYGNNLSRSKKYGSQLYKKFWNEEWIPLENDKYICQNCLWKRNNVEKQEAERRERQERERQHEAAEKQRKEDQMKKEEDERRRKEVEKRRHEEEQRQRFKQEEDRKIAEERQKREEYDQMRLDEQRRFEEQMRLDEQRRFKEQMRFDEQRRFEEERKQKEIKEQRLLDVERRKEEHKQQQKFQFIAEQIERQKQKREEWNEQRQQEQLRGAKSLENDLQKINVAKSINRLKKVHISQTDRISMADKNVDKILKEREERTRLNRFTTDSTTIEHQKQTHATSNSKYAVSSQENVGNKFSMMKIEKIEDEQCHNEQNPIRVSSRACRRQNISLQEKTIDELLKELEELNKKIDGDTESLRKVLNEVSSEKNRTKPPTRGKLVSLLNHSAGNFLSLSDEELSTCAIEICRGIQQTKSFWPRHNQMLSFCLLVRALGKGILLEINTGEGKTCIVAMFSVFLALTNKSVDIISSSPILAERDMREWEEFYKLFEVEVDCNVHHNDNEKRLHCYQKQIVYGTVGSFASDILRQEFLRENVRGDRQFHAIIVDEVDCMLLDQGVHSTYLSHQVPGMHHLQNLLLTIWNEVIRHRLVRHEKTTKVVYVGKEEPLHLFLAKIIPGSNKYELLKMYLNGRVRKGFIKDLIEQEKNPFGQPTTKPDILSELSIETMKQCLELFEEDTKFSFDLYRFENKDEICKVAAKEESKNETLLQLVLSSEGHVCVLYNDKKSLYKLIEDKMNDLYFKNVRKCKLKIPPHLKEFVKNRLSYWIENAFTANEMKNGRDYLILHDKIVPIDYKSTGVIEKNTKWGDSLHQFVEIKHGKQMSPLTIVTNFMSNQTFFERYQHKIFGVSGTLGSNTETSYLDRTFGLMCKWIPTHRRKNFKEKKAIICSTEIDWFDSIENAVKKQTDKRRAVLVVCEDIKTANRIYTKLSENFQSVSLYTKNDEDDRGVMKRKMKSVDIIVATNIAGRGTDIGIEEEVVKAGGLFVLVTFLPYNLRVEKQVFGRTARKGQPGKAQVILDRSMLPEELKCIEDIDLLKSNREEDESRRISDIERTVFQDVKVKDSLFAFYCKHLKYFNADHSSEIEQHLILSSLHESWGMWIKLHCDSDCQNLSLLQKKLKRHVKNAKRKVFDKDSPCSNISHIIKFANEEMKNKMYESAIRLYERAIRIEGKRAAVAFYNMAYCYIMQNKSNCIEHALKHLKSAKQSFEIFSSEVKLGQSLVICCMNETQENEDNLTLNQLTTRSHIVDFYIQNVDCLIKEIQKLRDDKKDIVMNCDSVFTILIGEYSSCKKVETELYLFWEMGLTDVFTVFERPSFCWKPVLVAMVGALQIAIGTVITGASSGSLANLGSSLIAEGINDVCFGFYSVYKSDQNFMTSWITEKGARIIFSVVCSGFSTISYSCKGNKNPKQVCSLLKEQFDLGLKKGISDVKSMSGTLTSVAFKKKFREIGKEAGRKLLHRGKEFLIENALSKVKMLFENETKQKIEKEVEAIMREKNYSHVVDKFILFQKKENKSKKEIAQQYMKITQKILNIEEIADFRQIVCACVKEFMRVTEKKFSQENQAKIVEECKPFFEIMNKINESSYDFKTLFRIYREKMEKLVIEINNDNSNENLQTDIKQNCEFIDSTKPLLVENTTEYIFDLLQKAYQYTGSDAIARAIENTVGNFVQQEFGVSRQTLPEMYQMSEPLFNVILSKDGMRDTDILVVTDGICLFTKNPSVRNRIDCLVRMREELDHFLKTQNIKDLSKGCQELFNKGLDLLVKNEDKRAQVKDLIDLGKEFYDLSTSKTFSDMCQKSEQILNTRIKAMLNKTESEQMSAIVELTYECIRVSQCRDFKDICSRSQSLLRKGVDFFVEDKDTKTQISEVLKMSDALVDISQSQTVEDLLQKITSVVMKEIHKVGDEGDLNSYVMDLAQAVFNIIHTENVAEIIIECQRILKRGINVFVEDNENRQIMTTFVDITAQVVQNKQNAGEICKTVINTGIEVCITHATTKQIFKDLSDLYFELYNKIPIKKFYERFEHLLSMTIALFIEDSDSKKNVLNFIRAATEIFNTPRSKCDDQSHNILEKCKNLLKEGIILFSPKTKSQEQMYGVIDCLEKCWTGNDLSKCVKALESGISLLIVDSNVKENILDFLYLSEEVFEILECGQVDITKCSRVLRKGVDIVLAESNLGKQIESLLEITLELIDNFSTQKTGKCIESVIFLFERGLDIFVPNMKEDTMTINIIDLSKSFIDIFLSISTEENIYGKCKQLLLKSIDIFITDEHTRRKLKCVIEASQDIMAISEKKEITEKFEKCRSLIRRGVNVFVEDRDIQKKLSHFIDMCGDFVTVSEGQIRIKVEKTGENIEVSFSGIIKFIESLCKVRKSEEINSLVIKSNELLKVWVGIYTDDVHGDRDLTTFLKLSEQLTEIIKCQKLPDMCTQGAKLLTAIIDAFVENERTKVLANKIVEWGRGLTSITYCNSFKDIICNIEEALKQAVDVSVYDIHVKRILNSFIKLSKDALFGLTDQSTDDAFKKLSSLIKHLIDELVIDSERKEILLFGVDIMESTKHMRQCDFRDNLEHCQILLRKGVGLFIKDTSMKEIMTCVVEMSEELFKMSKCWAYDEFHESCEKLFKSIVRTFIHEARKKKIIYLAIQSSRDAFDMTTCETVEELFQRSETLLKNGINVFIEDERKKTKILSAIRLCKDVTEFSRIQDIENLYSKLETIKELIVLFVEKDEIKTKLSKMVEVGRQLIGISQETSDVVDKSKRLLKMGIDIFVVKKEIKQQLCYLIDKQIVK